MVPAHSTLNFSQHAEIWHFDTFTVTMLSIYHLSHSIRFASYVHGSCYHFGRQLFWSARAEPSLGRSLCNATYQAAKWSLEPVHGPRKLSGECSWPTECPLGSNDDTFKPIGDPLRLKECLSGSQRVQRAIVDSTFGAVYIASFQGKVQPLLAKNLPPEVTAASRYVRCNKN